MPDRSRRSHSSKRTGSRTAVALAVAAVLLAGCGGAPDSSTAGSAGSTPSVSITPQAAISSTPTPAEPTSRSTPPSAFDKTDWEVEAEKSALLRNNIYSAGEVSTVRCDLPTGLLGSKAAVVRYITVMITCLDKAWRPLIVRSAYFEPVQVHTFNRKSTSPCGPGRDGVVAFYCASNHGIYLDWTAYVVESRSRLLGSQITLINATAHEYGHHVQELAGIMPYYAARYYRTTGAARLENSRRMELQASCFATAFFGANQQSLNLRGARLEELRLGRGGDEDYPGTPRDHGSASSIRIWEPAGFKSSSPGSCNTWAASAKRVS
ncbi:neutral zinc metallopeptidase [Kribbella qitaiheensis]|uniref:neutral zinc metallopeptidase n=1 Tax=Kribbella qitaiheensis TaxID=1544730 RepID=UPI00361943D0